MFGSIAWRLGPIVSDYSLKDLRLYTPRWVWPPSFKHTEGYRQLLESIRNSGVFRALLVLPDGQVVDGQHRYSCAAELGIESVPVRIIDMALPLSDANQLAIEDWAVYDAITRRHLTKAQATVMLYDLVRGRTEVQAKLAKLANLKRGNKASDIQPDPSHRTAKELAALADTSERSVKRALTIARHAPPDVQEQVRSGRLTLGGAEHAMKAAQAARNGGAEVTTAPDEAPGAAAADTDAQAALNGNGAAVTNTANAAPSRTASAPSAEERSEFEGAAEVFLDSVRAVVRKARIWNPDEQEHLFRALGQIEASLRDSALNARERAA